MLKEPKPKNHITTKKKKIFQREGRSLNYKAINEEFICARKEAIRKYVDKRIGSTCFEKMFWILMV